MSDASEALAMVGGGLGGVAAVAAAVRWLVTSRVKQGEVAVEKAESERDKTLSDVLKIVQKMETELAMLGVKLSNQAVETGEMKARIEGMSGNYGGRLGAVESRLAVLESRRRR